MFALFDATDKYPFKSLCVWTWGKMRAAAMSLELKCMYNYGEFQNHYKQHPELLKSILMFVAVELTLLIKLVPSFNCLF